MKKATKKKSCPSCRSKHITEVGYIVEHDYPGVTTVNENFEYTFCKPAPATTKLNGKPLLRLICWLSLFFTPFVAPFMALMIKLLYDGAIDVDETHKLHKKWSQQGFCYKCGVTWENPF